MAKESLMKVQHPIKNHKTEDYLNIILIRDREPRFIPDADRSTATR